MELSETRVIAAPQRQVWVAPLDRNVLKTCVPDCQELSGLAETGFRRLWNSPKGPAMPSEKRWKIQHNRKGG